MSIGQLVMQIQHPYAHSPAFPSNLYQRTVEKYDLDYHHQIMIIPDPHSMVLPQQKILVSALHMYAPALC